MYKSGKVSKLVTVKARFAFTMAEILLSLTIIGVVAAITLPSLMGNINERTWNTQRKALHARMSQAIVMMPQLNGYGTYIADTVSAGSVTSSGVDTTAEAFLTEGLSKVLKINNICDSEHLADCGIPDSINGTNGSLSRSNIKTLYGFNGLIPEDISINTKAAAFETQNGESIILYYNPQCLPNIESTSFEPGQVMCANFVYDLNGNKGPNTFGKDVGYITALYSVDSVVVAPIPTNINSYLSHQDAIGYCSSQDAETRLPNNAEMVAMFTNYALNPPFEADVWSGTVYTGDLSKAWLFAMTGAGGATVSSRTSQNGVWCIKR